MNVFLVSALITALFINDGEGFTPVKKNTKLQELLATHPTLDLHETAAVGTRQDLEAMLKADPENVRKRNSFGWTPLHMAAFAGNTENVELLISRGAEIESRAKTKFRNTPLQVALLTGEYGTAKILLDHGADPLNRQAKGFTPMHEAALLGRQDLVQLLLDHGAELNSRSDSGMTPLAEAIRGKHDELAAWMKEKGAKIEPLPDKE